jgi:hypothetical protein
MPCTQSVRSDGMIEILFAVSWFIILIKNNFTPGLNAD